jgi:xylose isomerase
LKLDLFPYREDAAQAASDSVDTIERLRGRAARLDADELAAARASHDALAAQRAVQRALLS